MNVLMLACLSQRFLAWGFDADEHAREVSLHHQVDEFRVVGEVDAGFSRKSNGLRPGLLPFDDPAQQLLGFNLVADKVVVNQETVGKALGCERLELRNDLFRAFDARPAAKDCDDVTEFTKKRAATRELDGHGGVATASQ